MAGKGRKPARTREDWLSEFAEACRPHFKELAGLDFGKVRLATGYVTRSVHGRTFIREVSTSGHCEIQVCYVEDNRIRIAGTLVHELIHAAGIRGHGKAFADAGNALGLTGKPTMMGWDDAKTVRNLPAWARPIFKACGRYPKGHIDLARVQPKPDADGEPVKPGPGRPNLPTLLTGAKPQTARLLKAECCGCGLVFRVTRKWAGRVTRCPDADCDGKMRIDGLDRLNALPQAARG